MTGAGASTTQEGGDWILYYLPEFILLASGASAQNAALDTSI